MASELNSPFKNFDGKDVFETIESKAESADKFNLAVHLTQHQSRAALDINAVDLKTFMQLDSGDQTAVKWIHLSEPDSQNDCIDEIATRYKLSSRLKAMIKTPHSITSAPSIEGSNSDRDLKGKSMNEKHKGALLLQDSDLEQGSQQTRSSVDIHNHYNIVSRVWHFWSIDWTERCLCIGYNSISNLVVRKPMDTSVKAKSRRKRLRSKLNPGNDDRDTPLDSELNGIRLWNWLLICDDKTIISLQESGGSVKHQAEKLRRSNEEMGQILKNSRRNLLNILRHLSSEGITKARAIDTLEIRPNYGRGAHSAINTSDSPGLLFYYLFDDWHTTFELVANDKCRYTTVLNDLRREMLQKAQVSRIDQLHQTGQQLHVLKRMYGSYNLIIDRILSRVKVGADVPVTEDDEQSEPSQRPQRVESLLWSSKFSDDGGKSFQVPLTPKASVRFERLRDRITMFALSEIEQCMEERESLVSFNFNLIAMRQSQAVEKLTRITILLAKVTILFMPVSVLTGYFSTQIDDLQHIYTAKTYWVSFAITVVLSLVFLVFFGLVSHTLEGGIIYQSTIQAATAPIRRFVTRGSSENRNSDSNR